MSTLIKSDVIKANTLPVGDKTIDGMYVSATRQPYCSPTPGELPLVALGGVKIKSNSGYTNAVTSPYLELIKQCGFNAVQYDMGESRAAADSMDYCEKAGVRNIVRRGELGDGTLNCPSSKTATSEAKDHLFVTNKAGDECEDGTGTQKWKARGEVVLSDWKTSVAGNPTHWSGSISPCWKSEACGGYELSDEPILRMYPWLAKIKDRIHTEDKWQSMQVVNLLPLHAEANEGGAGVGKLLGCTQRRFISVNESGTFDLRQAKSYQAQTSGEAYKIYLDEFEKVFHPSVWCYDGYLINGDTPSAYPPNLQYQYFESLEAIRNKAIETDRPFWGTIKCRYTPSKEWASSTWEIPDDYVDLLSNVTAIEARSTLAYGAKGLMFWSMLDCLDGGLTWGPLTLDGKTVLDGDTEIKKTPLYDRLQALLSGLKKHGDLFLSSNVTRTGHIRHEEYGKPISAINFEFIKDIVPGEGSYCLAHHVTPTGEFIVIVNTDVQSQIKNGVEVPYELAFENKDSYPTTELVGLETFDPNEGTMFQRPDEPSEPVDPGLGGGDDGSERHPDPLPKIRIGLKFNPGDWAILYRNRKENI